MGCDTVITLNLTVNQPSSSSISQTICSPNTYSFNGQSYSTTGTYTATLTNAAGCDSVVTLNLTVNPRPVFSVSLNGTPYNAQAGGHTISTCNNNNYSFTLAGVSSGSLPLVGTIRVWDGMIGTGTAGPIFTDTINSIIEWSSSGPSARVNDGTWTVQLSPDMHAAGRLADLCGWSMSFTFHVTEHRPTTTQQDAI